jgi:group I intron endonuclease
MWNYINICGRRNSMYIYKTTNIINGKFYIGLSKYKPKENPNYLGSGYLLKKAIKTYGKENFTKEILEESNSKEYILKRERYWISYYKSRERNIGYNICEGGTWGDNWKYCLNKEERRQFYSETRSGSGNPRYGDHRTYEEIHGKEKANKLKQDISKRFSGENNPMCNIEYRKKVSVSKMGEKNPNAKEWEITTPEGETIRFVGGIKRKLKELGLTYSKVKPHLEGKAQNYRGWIIKCYN